MGRLIDHGERGKRVSYIGVGVGVGSGGVNETVFASLNMKNQPPIFPYLKHPTVNSANRLN